MTSSAETTVADTSYSDTSYSDMSVSDMSSLSISCRPKRKIRPPKQDLDCAALISLVEQYPVLWDFEYPGYHNMDMRSQAWDAIAKRFHSTTGQDCLNMWKTIRKNLYQNEERHRKVTASGSKASRHKPYVFARQLFLMKLRNELDEITEGNGRPALDHLSAPLHMSSPLKTPKQELQSTLISSSSNDQLPTFGSQQMSDIWKQTTMLEETVVKKERKVAAKVTPSPKKVIGKRKNKEFKVMPTIDETEDEGNVDDPGGLLSPKVAKKNKEAERTAC
ncbi:Pyridoxine/pyridoxamine 5'-phosphate oxidase [Frankliniella fusca]|uniref:Pyridoxine/pyridoxamine 5'-phosphate oxidase n=1 Tax=Frankliniella fusca TaxID=407009 RepID=A0AAE1HZ35_9NEOP|nr:Pyridoxine/pyridoxamine 5'-phosphate oxidase [Frankliniella fusca]